MIIICFLVIICSLTFEINTLQPINDRPIIGVVTEEANSTLAKNATSFVLASYVKFLEASGARVVPIWIKKPRSYYEDIMSKINGVLFPGGGVSLSSPGYGRTGEIIFEIATKMNDNGDFFPLWGTCLGFELLNFIVAKQLWMTACDAEDIATNLDFTEGFKESKMFKDIDPIAKQSMIKEATMIHYHQWCITEKNYTLSGLNKYFNVLALNKDKKNLTFVSVVEARNYPFYGVSFHPEKIMFEWILSKTHRNIPHDLNAIRVAQYFGNFFVNEARKNLHHFPNKAMEDAALIYNYQPMFTGHHGTNPNTQTYFFYDH